MNSALLIGIDHYDYAPLNGCINDVNRLAALLSKHDDGRRNFECQAFTSDQHTITTDFLRKQIKRFFEIRSSRTLFYFSGHGNEALGGSMCTQNGTQHNPGVPMSDLFHCAHEALEKGYTDEVVILLDCCYSGYCGNLTMLGTETSVLKKGMCILTASRKEQYATTKNKGGLFTNYLEEALKGGTSDILGNVTLSNAYYYMDQALGAWDQRPILKVHLDHIPVLRRVKPAISIETIRQITTHFPTLDYQHYMSAAYPDTEKPRDAEKEQAFTDLRAYHRTGLVLPCTEASMYQEAMKNGACQLTAMGKAYWQLVIADKI